MKSGKKTIILLYDFLSEYGGIERVLLFQARALRKAGYNVKLAFAYVDDSLKNKLYNEFEVIEYSKLPFGYKDETLQICSSFFRDEFLKKLTDADLVITHSFPSSYVAYRLYKKYKIPYVQYLHHHPQFLYFINWGWANNTFKRKTAFIVGKFFGGYARAVDKKCVKSAKKIMVNSVMVQKIIKDIYGRVGSLHYPAIDNAFFEKSKDENKILEKYKVPKNFILASGRIVRLKRFDYLLRAYAKLPEQLKENYWLVFAGKDDKREKQSLIALARALKIKNIKFVGVLDKTELRVLYAHSKVTVLTCPNEYFGLVPVEAMASGSPVVSWQDNAGPQETIQEGINGYLTKPYSTTELSKNIARAVSRKWNAGKIKKSAEKFSEESVEKRFIAEIKELV